MKFRIETNLDQCQKLWEKFSPRLHLFDLWEYRYCFYQGYGYQPYFIAGLDPEGPVGVLPLWFEKKEKFYTFFGGTFPEPNAFFIKDKSKLAAFIEQCPWPTCLFYINQSEAKYYPLSKGEPKYFLDMNNYNLSVDQYFSAFSKKHRKNLRYDLRQFEKLNYTLRYDNLDDFEKMISLNQKRFQKTSDFNEKEMQVSMKKLMQVAFNQGKLNMISLFINKKVEAVEIAVIHNNCYYVLCGGHNLKIENIGKKMIVEHLNSALRKNITKIDFLSTNSGWKKLWHLETEPQFEYKN